MKASPADGDLILAETLSACNAGEPGAWDRLAPLVYGQLRRMAEAYLRGERRGHTLQPTALVHESFVRMVQQRLPKFESRSHFLGVAARQMRQVLVDSARAHRSGKRGGGITLQPLHDPGGGAVACAAGWGVIEVDAALRKLEATHPEQARAIELHYFGGFNVAEMSSVLQRSERSLARDLREARLFLARELKGE